MEKRSPGPTARNLCLSMTIFIAGYWSREISLDKFHDGLPINAREQILNFLDHRKKDGKWVKREHDADGKYISSFNCYLKLLTIFFRWLFNKDKSEDGGDWKTPTFLEIKYKKPLRASPYDVND